MTKGSAQAKRIRDTLLAVARDPKGASERLADLDQAELAGVLQAGTAQGLGSILVSSLQEGRFEVPTWLETHRFDMTVHRGTIMRALGVIAPAMTAADVPWVVLKGPVLAMPSESAGLREFADLDLLISGRDLALVLEVLDQIGVDAVNRNWSMYVRHGVAEFPVHMLGSPVDLHWHVIALGMIRDRFRIPIDELLARRETVNSDGIHFHRLDREDNVIQVALHTGLSGATSIGRLRDVHVILGGLELDWVSFVARAHRYGAASIIGHVLDRCRCVMGTAVPPEIPPQLTPVGALRMRRRLDAAVAPFGGNPGVSFSGFFVATSRSGISETGGRAGELLLDRINTWRGRPPRWSAYDPKGPLYWARTSGGANGRQRYLEYATQSSQPDHRPDDGG